MVAISTGSTVSQPKKQPIKHIALMSGTKTNGDPQPFVEPDVSAKINKMRATGRDVSSSIGGSSEEAVKCRPVNNDIPTRSRLLNFDTFD